jgi:uncharacterized protein YebE (UPF0316 family)
VPDLAELTLDLAAAWAVIWPALAIALLRLTDVTLNVFRTVFIVQERRVLSALVAGLEAGTWLSAAGIVFADMTPIRAAGFVLGVALGTAVGVELTRKLRLGMVTVRIYADASGAADADQALGASGAAIARAIHDAGFGATVFRGTGFAGPVDMVLSTVRRRDADAVLTIARGVAPESFAAIDNSLHPSPVTVGTTVGRV